MYGGPPHEHAHGKDQALSCRLSHAQQHASVTKVRDLPTPRGIRKILESASMPKDISYMRIDLDNDDCATLVGQRSRKFQAFPPCWAAAPC